MGRNSFPLPSCLSPEAVSQMKVIASPLGKQKTKGQLGAWMIPGHLWAVTGECPGSSSMHKCACMQSQDWTHQYVHAYVFSTGVFCTFLCAATHTAREQTQISSGVSEAKALRLRSRAILSPSSCSLRHLGQRYPKDLTQCSTGVVIQGAWAVLLQLGCWSMWVVLRRRKVKG